MNPDQAASMDLNYRLPKNISRREEKTTKVVTDGKRITNVLDMLSFFFVPVNNSQLSQGGSSWVEQLLSKDKCVLLKDTI